jgi:hypothetical protein
LLHILGVEKETCACWTGHVRPNEIS